VTNFLANKLDGVLLSSKIAVFNGVLEPSIKKNWRSKDPQLTEVFMAYIELKFHA